LTTYQDCDIVEVVLKSFKDNNESSSFSEYKKLINKEEKILRTTENILFPPTERMIDDAICNFM
jgi:hypothetical protein